MKNSPRICNNLALALPAFLFMALVGCGTHANKTQNASRLLVVAGETVGESDPAYNAIVKLDLDNGQDLCSGAFVNSTTLLTANHCVRNRSVSSLAVSLGIKAVNVFNRADVEFLGPWDLAVVVFPKGTAERLGITNPLRITSQTVQRGDAVEMVGYGATDYHSRSGAGVKRRGTNAVDNVIQGMIMFDSASSTTDSSVSTNDAGIANGDSGGPLFNAQREIIGVASGNTPASGKMQNVFVDIQSPLSKQLIDEAVNCSSGPCAEPF